jgi:two-component system phosphate regulon sensor histidine kinase PhoR
MEWIIATLVIALGLSIVWGWRQRQIALQSPPPPPQHDSFSPLFHAAAHAFDDGLCWSMQIVAFATLTGRPKNC